MGVGADEAIFSAEIAKISAEKIAQVFKTICGR